MKAGDRLWIAVRVNDDAEDAIDELVIHDPDDINVTHWSRIEEDMPIPDHPALPAVVRWLAEHNDALVYGQHTPGDWIDVIDAYADEGDNLADRMMLKESVIPALRSLIAALTEGQG